MKRKIFDELVVWKSKSNRKPLILKGARQVGKTYILKEFGEKNFSNLHYFNFEKDETIHQAFERDLNPTRIIQDLSFHQKKPIQPQHDLVVFDEIQHCPRALTSLKYFCEDMSELAICSAGSLLGIFLTDVSFPVGKVDFLKMHPLSFEEFIRGVDEEEAALYISDKDKQKNISPIVHDRLWQLLKHFFVTGGLPEVVNAYRENKNDLYAAMTLVREKQNTLISAYHADIAKHSGKENAMHISAVLKNIPNQLARELDGSVTRFRFTQVIPGASKYSRLAGKIHWLETAGLITRVPIVNRAQLPLSAYTKENFFKLYLFDVGILGALSNLSPKTILDYDYGSYKGYFAENFFVQEEQNTLSSPLHGWKEGGAEVEFLKEIDGDIYPVEVKSGFVTQAKSLKAYAEKYNPKYRVIVSANPFMINPTHKMLKCPLYLTAQLESFLPSSP